MLTSNAKSSSECALPDAMRIQWPASRRSVRVEREPESSYLGFQPADPTHRWPSFKLNSNLLVDDFTFRGARDGYSIWIATLRTERFGILSKRG